MRRRCEYCGVYEDEGYIFKDKRFKELDRHHMIPKNKGGTDKQGRLLLCKNCHVKVQNKINHAYASFEKLIIEMQSDMRRYDHDR